MINKVSVTYPVELNQKTDLATLAEFSNSGKKHLRFFLHFFQHGLFTTVHKYYSVDEWKKFAEENPSCLPNMAASAGMAEADYLRLSDVLHAVPGITFICLDVANGYSQHFVDFVRKVRAAFPTHTIIVRFVCTNQRKVCF